MLAQLPKNLLDNYLKIAKLDPPSSKGISSISGMRKEIENVKKPKISFEDYQTYMTVAETFHEMNDDKSAYYYQQQGMQYAPKEDENHNQ